MNFLGHPRDKRNGLEVSWQHLSAFSVGWVGCFKYFSFQYLNIAPILLWYLDALCILNPFTAAEVLSLKAEHLKWTQLFKKMDTYQRKYWCVVYEIIRCFFSTSLIIFRAKRWQGGFPLQRMCDLTKTKQFFKWTVSSGSHLTHSPFYSVRSFLILKRGHQSWTGECVSCFHV